uniref:Bromo domain-containing protein n=1 Tax=Maylandia zebra TaxID=106582 RepID=A0A3P9BDH9_9CICH
LSLCEEAVSEGHTLPGPWETQELKASEPTPTIQESAPPQTPQDMVATLAPTPASQETQNQPDTNREEPLKGNYEGPEVTGSDVTSSVTSDDGVAASEVAEEGPVVKEVTEATVKSEGEEWSQDSLESYRLTRVTLLRGNRCFTFANIVFLRYASVFLQPVSDDIAPGYHSIVHRPMDLSAIKKNIESGVIRTTAEFQRDIMLMFQNAVMYNSSDHDVYHMALEMQRDVLEHVQQFLLLKWCQLLSSVEVIKCRRDGP